MCIAYTVAASSFEGDVISLSQHRADTGSCSDFSNFPA